MDGMSAYRGTDGRFETREYRPEDIAGMTALWHEVFGDDEEFIRGFYRLLPGWGSAAVAADGDGISGIAHMLRMGDHVAESGEAHSCAYLYAVAVREDCRGLGLGAELSRLCAELVKAEITCTLPADEGLYRWYGRILGLDRFLPSAYVSAGHFQEIIMKDRDCAPVSPPQAELKEIPCAEYFALREKYLAGRDHLRLSAPAQEMQDLIRGMDGGRFMTFDGGICLFFPEEDFPERKGIAYRGVSVPPDCVWSYYYS